MLSAELNTIPLQIVCVRVCVRACTLPFPAGAAPSGRRRPLRKQPHRQHPPHPRTRPRKAGKDVSKRPSVLVPDRGRLPGAALAVGRAGTIVSSRHIDVRMWSRHVN